MVAICDKALAQDPRLVLALSAGEYATAAGRCLRRLGWDVQVALSGREARRLADEGRAEVIVLSIDQPDESGWLTCEKLMREQAARQIVLVAGQAGPFDADFAAFVGAAALVSKTDGISALIDEVRGAALAAAC
jgi:DNA-binding response OmpR family regulator